MAVDEWPDDESFQAFFDAAGADIGPFMAAVGVTAPPDVKVWGYDDIDDVFGWGAAPDLALSPARGCRLSAASDKWTWRESRPTLTASLWTQVGTSHRRVLLRTSGSAIAFRSAPHPEVPMLHLRRDVVPALQFETDLPDQRHAALTLLRGIAITLVALSALALFLVGALALGAVVMIS